MNEVSSRPYLLLHITSEKNFNKINSDRKLNMSVHNVEKGKIQWLGDGIYFWDANDDFSLKLGKNLAKGKYKNNKMIGIYVNVEIDSTKHMNLENNKWYQIYSKFLEKFFPNEHKKIIEYLDMIKKEKDVKTKDLNQIGELIGTTINFFLKVLSEENKMEVDMVSGKFYHGQNSFSIFKSQEKMVRQFCVKNDQIINNCFGNWRIKHNI